ncbi:hypothetical protein [Gordonia sihwensis]|uniref:hypothetical protein n=1 Tax=Gordonia sihwensis TaxID=173559 RepID=UPI0005ED8B3D|nr:hypothetical protein [Gordonia sihwensis]KJR10452.1 hypothetical protein UG54_00165 [Gordonia sihwensis]
MASTTTPTRQQWWKDLATDLTDLTVCDVIVRRSTRTTLQKRRSLTGRRLALALTIDRHDLDEHTDTEAGRWILTQQAALITAEKPQLAVWARRLQVLLLATALISACTAILITGPWQLFAAVIAGLFGLGCGWLVRERRREHLIDVIAADHAATTECGTDAALTALSDRPVLYKSKLHTLLEQRDPISVTNRIDRLQAHR